MYIRFLKRTIDFLVSFSIFLLFMPLFLLLVIILSWTNKGKPFFFQIRPGKDAKLFKIIKFKTMNDEKDHLGNLLPPNERITGFGKFIRSTSLDEIPQLINVLKGDMSLIGPRPLRVEYLPLYSQFQAKRHEIKPGITGWAQINGRNTLDWEKRFEMDVWYVENRSFLLDLKILFLTVKKVLVKEGIDQSKEKIMEPFKNVKLNG